MVFSALAWWLLRVPGGPGEALGAQPGDIRVPQVVEVVADGAVEHPAPPPRPGPRLRDPVPVDPGHVLAGEGGLGQHVIVRVDGHVVLLGGDAEVADTSGDLVRFVHYGYFVRVLDPLPRRVFEEAAAEQPVVLDARAERGG